MSNRILAWMPLSRLDVKLLLPLIGLLVLGMVMVASASMGIAEKQFGDPFYYLLRHVAYLSLGVAGAFLAVSIETRLWQKISLWCLLLGVGLLIIVLIPGIGHTVNGSTRWLGIGSRTLQVSEVVKICMIIFLAAYLVRHHQAFTQKLSGFLKPLLVFVVMAGLLLLEPDFGAAVVLMLMALGLMFLAGLPLLYFFVLVLVCILALGIVAVLEPYRLERLVTFLNPWAHPYDSGYQLTQALIAFGRGQWLGLGLGAGVQKLFYLPEAHTDFVLAVLAEELGLIGVIATLALYTWFLGRIFLLGKRALALHQPFHAYLAYGIGLCFGLQVLVNVGVNLGLLPTKGLTLPFLSYGGSSLLVSCIMAGMLLRVSYEVERN